MNANWRIFDKENHYGGKLSQTKDRCDRVNNFQL